MIFKKIVSDINEAFNDYIGVDCKFFVDKKTVSTGKAIRAIRTAGGICIIAHPGEYHFLPNELKLFLNFVKIMGSMGLSVSTQNILV